MPPVPVPERAAHFLREQVRQVPPHSKPSKQVPKARRLVPVPKVLLLGLVRRQKPFPLLHFRYTKPLVLQ